MYTEIHCICQQVSMQIILKDALTAVISYAILNFLTKEDLVPYFSANFSQIPAACNYISVMSAVMVLGRG